MSFIDQYSNFNEELNIYRTVIIVNDYLDQEFLFNQLQNNDYSVYKTQGFGNDFEIFFKRNLRIFIMLYADFLDYNNYTLNTIAEEHNFLVIYKLDQQEHDTAINTFIDIRKKNKIEDDYYIWTN
jgi:hypothetical protein